MSTVGQIDPRPIQEVMNFITRKKDFAFQRSQAGSSGLTYLPMEVEFKWVVKWQNRTQAEIEYLCTEFYKRAFNHLSVPSMLFNLSQKPTEILRRYFDGVAEIHVPLLIEYKNGN